MHRRFSFMMGTIGAFSLVLGGLNGDMYAQRGAGAGHAAVPTNVGQGRRLTAGRPDTAGQSHTSAGKPDTTGQPTIADQLTRDHGLATQLQKMLDGDGVTLGAAIHALDPKRMRR